MEPLSIRRGKSRAINAENPTGEKGRGGMASSNLGKSRKGSPCLTNIAPGDEVVLADIQGSGVISHIWITVDDKTSEADCFVMRDLILRLLQICCYRVFRIRSCRPGILMSRRPRYSGNRPVFYMNFT